MDEDSVVREQIDYYRKRAPEYDATASPPGDPLAAYGKRLTGALDRFAPSGSVLEIASGTGGWTIHLLQHAHRVTALDSSPEMHELSRRKLGSDRRVRYVVADVFGWEPNRKYDVVFFANWLSHVPPGLFDPFWGTVKMALVPQGRVFFIDEVVDAWRNEESLREEFAEGTGVPIVRRTLSEGRTFRVVKVFWDPAKLESTLRRLGWAIRTKREGPFFWGAGRRAD